MISEIAISICVFVAGCLSARFVGRRFGGLFDGVDPLRLGIWLLVAAIGLVSASELFYSATGSYFVYYAFLFIAGSAFNLPLMLMIYLYLLWWNPGKYKEYEMKKLRRKRLELARAQVEKND